MQALKSQDSQKREGEREKRQMRRMKEGEEDEEEGVLAVGLLVRWHAVKGIAPPTTPTHPPVCSPLAIPHTRWHTFLRSATHCLQSTVCVRVCVCTCACGQVCPSANSALSFKPNLLCLSSHSTRNKLSHQYSIPLRTSATAHCCNTGALQATAQDRTAVLGVFHLPPKSHSSWRHSSFESEKQQRQKHCYGLHF